MLSSYLSRCLTWAAAALFAASCSAQVMRDPGTMPSGRRVHFPGAGQTVQPAATEQQGKAPAAQVQSPQAQIKTGAPVAAHAQAPPPMPPRQERAPSLLDKPPQPATFTFSGGRLAVEAKNSSLSQILDRLASSTGMTIDGLSHDQRVFGIYGPGTPMDVLSSLLDDAGYNVMMLGVTQRGAPREIILTARSNAPPPAAQASQADQQSQADNEEDDNPQPTTNLPFPQQHYAPEAQTPPPQPGAVKTPAQILQELQQLRQQQQQQGPPQ